RSGSRDPDLPGGRQEHGSAAPTTGSVLAQGPADRAIQDREGTLVLRRADQQVRVRGLSDEGDGTLRPAERSLSADQRGFSSAIRPVDPALRKTIAATVQPAASAVSSGVPTIAGHLASSRRTALRIVATASLRHPG